jgi:hypothetical protein
MQGWGLSRYFSNARAIDCLSATHLLLWFPPMQVRRQHPVKIKAPILCINARQLHLQAQKEIAGMERNMRRQC